MSEVTDVFLTSNAGGGGGSKRPIREAECHLLLLITVPLRRFVAMW